jgi:hypothetical protein
VHFELLRYLVAVGARAAKGRAELAARFQHPNSGASNQAYLTAARALMGVANEQKDVLVEAGMAPRLLEELEKQVSEFEAASTEARMARSAHIGARAELNVLVRDLMKEIRILDGMYRWSFARHPQVMVEWVAARDLIPASPRPDRRRPARR